MQNGIDSRTAPLGALVLRLALGVMLIAHSVYLKGIVFTLPGTAKFFVSLDLPAFSAYAVFAIEAAAGIALILGVQSRLAALAVVPVLLGATWVHIGNGWLFTNQGGGWEYPLFLVAAAMVQALVGGGALQLSRDLEIPVLGRVLAAAR